MARTVTIPIDDEAGKCIESYTVLYKLIGDEPWTPAPLTPYPFSPIVLENLLDDAEYDVRIIRNCCGGLTSDPLDIVIDTTAITSPV